MRTNGGGAYLVGSFVRQNFPQDEAKRVHVRLLSVRLTIVVQDFRCHPIQCAHLRVDVIVLVLAQSKIGDFDLECLVHEQVQRLKITMNDGWYLEMQVHL